MANELAFLPEYMFISYDGCIKNYRVELIKYILKNYREEFSTFIDVENLSKLDDEYLKGICLKSTRNNILEYLATREYDYSDALIKVYRKDEDLFYKSSLLKIGSIVNNVLVSKFTKVIYIWTPTYDPRIHKDIIDNFGNSSIVKYTTGDFLSVLKDVPEKITTFILNDVYLINQLMTERKIISNTNILIAKYGFNYIVKDEEYKILMLNIKDLHEYMKKYKFNVFEFLPYYDYKMLG